MLPPTKTVVVAEVAVKVQVMMVVIIVHRVFRVQNRRLKKENKRRNVVEVTLALAAALAQPKFRTKHQP